MPASEGPENSEPPRSGCMLGSMQVSSSMIGGLDGLLPYVLGGRPFERQNSAYIADQDATRRPENALRLER